MTSDAEGGELRIVVRRARAVVEPRQRPGDERLVLLLHRERLLQIRRELRQRRRSARGGDARLQPPHDDSGAGPPRSPNELSTLRVEFDSRPRRTTLSGSHTSEPKMCIVPVKPSGMIPTTEKRRPLMMISRAEQRRLRRRSVSNSHG